MRTLSINSIKGLELFEGLGGGKVAFADIQERQKLDFLSDSKASWIRLTTTVVGLCM